MKKINGHEIIQLFEQFSPKQYAMEGDRIGLQIGRLNKPVHRVMIALDVLEEVVDEAIEKEGGSYYCTPSTHLSSSKEYYDGSNAWKND